MNRFLAICMAIGGIIIGGFMIWIFFPIARTFIFGIAENQSNVSNYTGLADGMKFGALFLLIAVAVVLGIIGYKRIKG